MVRRQGQAPGSELTQAVRRAGYRAELIPTYQLTLDCPTMGREGGPDAVRKALVGVRGVRGIGFPERTKAIVYYDRRQTSAAQLMRLFKGKGVGCSQQG